MGDADTGEASGSSPAPSPCSSCPYPGASSVNSRWTSPTCSPSSSSSSFSPTSSGSSESTRGAFYASPLKKKLKTGSFRLTVDVLPHPVFSPAEEGGAALHATVSISVAEALMGFTREITGLDGSTVTVRYDYACLMVTSKAVPYRRTMRVRLPMAMAMVIPSNAIVQQPLANVRSTPLWCSYEYRRSSRTLPGMTLRFPGLGMPLYSPAENKRVDERAESARRSGRGETLPGRASEVVEVGSEELRDGRATRDRGTVVHGDLVVEALVKLPVGETICLDFFSEI